MRMVNQRLILTLLVGVPAKRVPSWLSSLAKAPISAKGPKGKGFLRGELPL